jgi:hypothetical protein
MRCAVVFTSEAGMLEHPGRLVEPLRARPRINIPDRGYTTAPMSEFPYVGNDDDFDERGDMTSLRKNKTGVDTPSSSQSRATDSTAPHIKIAINPPMLSPLGEDSINGASR